MKALKKRLLAGDVGLQRACSEATLQRLANFAVPAVELKPGPFEPSELAPRQTLGMLVESGLLARTVEVPTASSIELLSPGDLLQPWTVQLPSFTSTSWNALERTTLLVIDTQSTAVLAAHQELLTEIVSRGIRRAHTLSVNAAIESIVGVENRLLLAMWHLAERYGSVTPEGVSMPLPLTHELFAVLIGSRRPSVTSALASLTEQGLISRRSDRTWLLSGTPPG